MDPGMLSFAITIFEVRNDSSRGALTVSLVMLNVALNICRTNPIPNLTFGFGGYCGA